MDYEGAAGDEGHREMEDDDASGVGTDDDEDMLRTFLAQQPLAWLVEQLLESAGKDPLLLAGSLLRALGNGALAGGEGDQVEASSS